MPTQASITNISKAILTSQNNSDSAYWCSCRFVCWPSKYLLFINANNLKQTRKTTPEKRENNNEYRWLHVKKIDTFPAVWFEVSVSGETIFLPRSSFPEPPPSVIIIASVVVVVFAFLWSPQAMKGVELAPRCKRWKIEARKKRSVVTFFLLVELTVANIREMSRLPHFQWALQCHTGLRRLTVGDWNCACTKTINFFFAPVATLLLTASALQTFWREAPPPSSSSVTVCLP